MKRLLYIYLKEQTHVSDFPSHPVSFAFLTFRLNMYGVIGVPNKKKRRRKRNDET